MASIYQNLKTDRQYSASTGLTQEEFNNLYIEFETVYKTKANNSINGKPAFFLDKREALFFILYYLKNYPTLEMLGLSFGTSDATVSNYIKYILPFLKKVLEQKKVLASRVFKTEEEFKKTFEAVEDIYIDGTEIPIERSSNYETQKESYSGKKKFHTLIMLIICDKNRNIHYLGKLYLGSTVDFALFKKELANHNYEQINIWVDLGFVGIKNVLGENAKIHIGHKKSKKQPLTEEQKKENQQIAKIRIKVEHAIGRMKRYYILRNENRMKKPVENKNLDLIVEICVGLSNFKAKKGA